MRKYAIPILIAVLLAGLISTPALAEPKGAPAPQPAGTASPRDWDKKLGPDGNMLPTAVNAESAILIDAKTGLVLFEKDADTKQYPASTTKIMTCLLALEKCTDLNKIVTIGNLPEADHLNGAENISLKKDEQISMENLLYALMVYSANDAADAIAMEISGSIESFVAMMNDKAKELGMTNTNYEDTNGLADDTNHYTTARDMSKLAMAAMHSKFLNLVSTAKFTLPADNKRTKAKDYGTTNHLLMPNDMYYYKYATGIKTGYTKMAESSFVSSAQKDDMSLVSVVMRDKLRTDIWVDSVTMFEYGFNYFDTMDLSTLLNSKQFSLDVKNAAADDSEGGKLSLAVSAPTSSTPYLTDKQDEIAKLKGDPSQFDETQTISEDTAPIKKDDVVGTVSYAFRGKVVMTCNLVASRDVKAMPPSTKNPSGRTTNSPSTTKSGSSSGSTTNSSGSTALDSINKILPVLLWVGVGVLIILLALLTIRLVNMRKRNRKYRQFNYKQGGGGMRARR